MKDDYWFTYVCLTWPKWCYEFNINVPWCWINWFLILIWGCDAGLTDPGPLEMVHWCLGAGPGVTPSSDEQRPGTETRQHRPERERGAGRDLAQNITSAPRPGQTGALHCTQCSNRAIALILLCNQGIKCSSWGAAVYLFYSLWPEIELDIHFASGHAEGLAQHASSVVTDTSPLVSSWDVWSVQTSDPEAVDLCCDMRKYSGRFQRSLELRKFTQPLLSRQMMAGPERLNISTIFIRSCLGCLVSRYDLCHDIKDQTIFQNYTTIQTPSPSQGKLKI